MTEFDDAELRMLANDIGANEEMIWSDDDKHAERAIELTRYAARHGALGMLLDLVERERPAGPLK